MGDSNKQVNANAWLTDVIRVNEEGELLVDMPKEILSALLLNSGDSLLWTLLPNGMGFSVNKVGKSLKELNDGASE